jgi:hypothetical protein
MVDRYTYDFANAPSLVPGPSREQEAARQRQLQQTRAAIEGTLAAPLQAVLPTSLPEIGGLVGTLAPILASESRLMAPIMGATARLPAVVRPYAPTLIGSTIGTTAGTLAEQGLGGADLLSSPTAKAVLENVVENAVYDIGGNLVFSALGKTYKVSKDKLSEFKTQPGMFDTSEGAARKQAQEWFVRNSDKATLTKGQLTGDVTTQGLEAALRVAPGSGAVFEQGAKQRVEALNKGITDVMSTLDTSDAFKQALKVDVPANMATTQSAVGGRFQTAMTTALDAMKAKYRPTYKRMEQEGDGLLVDLTAYKQDALNEISRLEKRYKSGNYPDSVQQQLDVLNKVASLDDVVPLSAAHEIRSDFLTSARGLQQEGKATSEAEVWYNKAASGLRNQMDRVAVITFGNEEEKAMARKLGLIGGIDQPAGLRSGEWVGKNFKDIESMNLGTTQATRGNNPLLRDYWNAQQGYKDAMEGLQDATIRSALKEDASSVGRFLFDPTKPDRITSVQNAIREAQKYLPAEQSKGLMSELQYGYLDELFGKPSGLSIFNEKMQDKTFKEGFNMIFKGNKQLQEIANAAKYGLEEEAGTTLLRTRAGVLGTQALAGGTLFGLSYLANPEKTKDLAQDPLALVSSGVAIILTPYLMSKALNNREAMTGLASIAKAQSNTKYGGSLAARGFDMLNGSGIIDSEYYDNLQNMIRAQQQQEQQPRESAPSRYDFDFNAVPVE